MYKFEIDELVRCKTTNIKMKVDSRTWENGAVYTLIRLDRIVGNAVADGKSYCYRSENELKKMV